MRVSGPHDSHRYMLPYHINMYVYDWIGKTKFFTHAYFSSQIIFSSVSVRTRICSVQTGPMYKHSPVQPQRNKNANVSYICMYIVECELPYFPSVYLPLQKQLFRAGASEHESVLYKQTPFTCPALYEHRKHKHAITRNDFAPNDFVFSCLDCLWKLKGHWRDSSLFFVLVES